MLKRFIIFTSFFIVVFVPLWIGWCTYSDLKLFPNDIIGVGYEAPLPNNYKVQVISIPDYGSISNEADRELIQHVDSLAVIGNIVIGKETSSFFLLNTCTHRLKYYSTLRQLKEAEGIESFSMATPIDYYWINRRPIDVKVELSITIVSALFAFLFTCLYRRKRPN